MIGLSSFGKDISVITEDKNVIGIKELFTKIYECSNIIEKSNNKTRQNHKLEMIAIIISPFILIFIVQSGLIGLERSMRCLLLLSNKIAITCYKKK